jgi:hypothetical protein
MILVYGKTSQELVQEGISRTILISIHNDKFTWNK